MKPKKNAKRNPSASARLIEFDENELTFERVYAESDEIGRELMDIRFGTPDDPEDLMTMEEIEAEIARRRGGLGHW